MPASLLTVTPLTASGISHVFDNIPYGPFAWYDASKISGIASGTSLSAWTDVSGNGNHITQSSAVSQPTLQTSSTSMNGLPIVRSDGTSMTLSTTFSAINEPYSVAVACFLQAQPGANKTLVHLRADNARAIGYRATGTAWRINHGATEVVDSLATASRSYTITAVFNGSLSTLRCQSITTTGSINTAASDGIGIGGDPAGNFMRVDYGEVLLYNRALTISELTLLESYLTTKWGTL